MTDTDTVQSERTLRLVRTDRETPPEPKPQRSGALGRVLGLDLARALAIFGMFYAHVGPMQEFTNPVVDTVMQIPHGRSSALFAILAGLSLVLLAGGRRPRPALERRQRIVKIAIRAVLLIALGTALALWLHTDIVILAFYGLFFLLALPFVRCGVKTLAVLSAAFALVGSVVFYWISMAQPAFVTALNAHDPVTRMGADGLGRLLFTGLYPAVPWMAYLFAGMAIAKLDLAAKAVRIGMASVGAGLALVGYGLSWVLQQVLFAGGGMGGGSMSGGPGSSGSGSASSSTGSSGTWSDSMSGFDPWSPDMLQFLLSASPHSGTAFELLGNIGIAMLVIVGSVALLDRSALARKLLTPITAAGAMSLTLYVAHLWALNHVPSNSDGGAVTAALAVWGWFCLAGVAFAFVWSRFFKRGPLEYLMHWATSPAKLIR
ncbi:heparan-alpha-glucosaminide N-acetyltransferase domain-containing protein [Glycomyces tritici]|uniref:Heparan-alpha-glucosaminide N-acetyltransferase domain-containing protein n=1 Tax=Glycomyces tritici TaxID=2665176 RepID=A0ABT7YTY1_9ACTN|nr:heparan-alpha-glucosaminide N-acetyltransferase domain-containing protein [Glycomyces tritici]MDN3242098.1 heparan-alpha-glucosaminide N-acetyltransferase domain-containing protein [Glycomyces tritici]MDN3243678.1 heparan-alpha-glucosaminide N-acetyltransferase domain-containing protein [Glycomyces tritici]